MRSINKRTIMFALGSWLSCVVPVHTEVVPKMLAKEAVPGEHLAGVSPEQRRRLSQGTQTDTEKLKSKTSIEIGECGPEKPFSFHVGAGSGRGAIGFINEKNEFDLIVVNDFKNETIVEMPGPPVPNVHHIDGMNDRAYSYTAPFDFINVPKEGAIISIACSEVEERLMIIVRDDLDIEVEAYVLSVSDSENNKILDVSGNSPSTKVSMLQSDGGGQVNQKKNILYTELSTQRVVLSYDEPGSVVLAQVEMEDEQGGMHPRTFVMKLKQKPSLVADLTLVASKIREDGDLEIKFSGLGSESKYFKLDVRATVVFDDGVNLDTIDITAIVNDGIIVIHNEWFRRAFQRAGRTGQNNGWDIYIDAIASDPDDGYRIVAHTSEKVSTSIFKDPVPLRSKLTATIQEHVTTNEMKTGRIPPYLRLLRTQNRNLRYDRSLNENHKKILVHGYCTASSAFNTSDFTDYIEFSDPSEPASWSYNEFALNIIEFTERNNIDGCSCIGHSQGGAACLHMYTFFNSCLDNAKYGGSRLLQAIAAPFHGTALAGPLADIGSFFGFQCGSCTDMTYDGAAKWLTSIPDWARSQMHYYTTSYADIWWRYDFCVPGSSLILNKPEDGTVEQWSGQLPGGINHGHTIGQCHWYAMRDIFQNYDSNRNKEMNENAKY